MYTKETITPVLEQAKFAVGILQAAGYDAHIVGGALRVLAVGGSTADVDIAVIGPTDEQIALHNDLRILFKYTNFEFRLQNVATYGGKAGFLSDWRSGSINVINYDAAVYSTVVDLVQGFDFNFNMYLLSNNDTVYNVFKGGTDKVYLNTNIATHHNIKKVHTERLPRFRKMLSHLDWSAV